METWRKEVFHMVAAGMLTELKANLDAIAQRDTRGVLERDLDIRGWLRMRAAVPLQYAVSPDAVSAMLSFVEDIRFDPAYSSAVVLPVNARVEGGTTLAADGPGSPWTLMVYSWDFEKFTQVGPLAENATPGPGYWVIVPERESQLGLPSGFLQTTA